MASFPKAKVVTRNINVLVKMLMHLDIIQIHSVVAIEDSALQIL